MYICISNFMHRCVEEQRISYSYTGGQITDGFNFSPCDFVNRSPPQLPTMNACHNLLKERQGSGVWQTEGGLSRCVKSR